jgi:hypothetical protein
MEIQMSSEIIQVLGWVFKSGVNRDIKSFWKLKDCHFISERRGRSLEQGVHFRSAFSVPLLDHSGKKVTPLLQLRDQVF